MVKKNWIEFDNQEKKLEKSQLIKLVIYRKY